MIINTGGRTDTVQYYSNWLLRRFGGGVCAVPAIPCFRTR